MMIAIAAHNEIALRLNGTPSVQSVAEMIQTTFRAIVETSAEASGVTPEEIVKDKDRATRLLVSATKLVMGL